MADASAIVISSPYVSLYMRRNSSSRSGETWWPVGDMSDDDQPSAGRIVGARFCHIGNSPTALLRNVARSERAGVFAHSMGKNLMCELSERGIELSYCDTVKRPFFD